MVRPHFAIVYDSQVHDQLRVIDRKYHALIRQTIETQLTYEPEVETRNRKPLLREMVFDADWELRFGPDNRFRVFYAVDSERREVQILAVGIKSGNRLHIAGEVIDL
jgi:mRNA-degrading endonuclease RelE of RelBE toxin-antitoxin system